MGVIEYLKGLYSVYDRVFSMRSLQAPTVITPFLSKLTQQ